MISGTRFSLGLAVLLAAGTSATAEEATKQDRGSSRESRVQSVNPVNSGASPVIAAAVSRLGDARFEIREEATNELGRAGSSAIEPLLAAAMGENLEVIWRAVKALGRILDTEDEATFDAAEGALERLESSSNRSAARRASAALDLHPDRRWKRGMARFEAAGGWVARMDKGPTYLVVGPEWNAGPAGLVNVKRMDSALQAKGTADHRIGVYVVDGCGIPLQAVDEIQHSLRIMEFASRGRARLAVSFSFDFRGRAASVSKIESDAAEATRLNLKEGDVIVKYDGETLIDFDHLTRITRRHEVGDRLPVEVLRNGEAVEFEIELTGWKKPESKAPEK